MILVVREQNSTYLFKSVIAQHKSFLPACPKKETKGELNKDNFSVLLLENNRYHLVIMESIFHNQFYFRVTIYSNWNITVLPLQFLTIQICVKISLQSIIKLDHKIDYRSFSSVHPMKLKKEKLMNEYPEQQKRHFQGKNSKHLSYWSEISKP